MCFGTKFLYKKGLVWLTWRSRDSLALLTNPLLHFLWCCIWWCCMSLVTGSRRMELGWTAATGFSTSMVSDAIHLSFFYCKECSWTKRMDENTWRWICSAVFLKAMQAVWWVLASKMIETEVFCSEGVAFVMIFSIMIKWSSEWKNG